MKREDSKKHYKEEKPALKKESILRIIFLLFYSTSLFAQIPINGFCKLTEFKISPSYSAITALDYNSDGYRDLVVSNPVLNNYAVLTANSRSGFSRAVEKYSSFNPSIISSYSSDQNTKKFVALSRKSREAGIVSFARNGSLYVNYKIKLDGYASTIAAGRVDDSTVPNILCAGTGIEGLILSKERNGKLSETDRIKGKIFSAAIFTDLNYDGYKDIAAVDLISNSIVFYNNDGAGNFEESRSIGLLAEVSEFRALDFNSDRFTDLAYIKNNNLEILIGDSVSSFQKKHNFITEKGLSKYSIMDFNGDGFNDVAIIDKSKSSLIIHFAKGINSFHQPICYLTKTNLSDLVSYVDRGGRKLVVVSSDGTGYLISSLLMQEDSFGIALQEGKAFINSYDYNLDGYKEIAFVDEGSNSLKIGLSERRNLFRTFYSLQLLTTPNKFIIDDSRRNITTFICYKKGGTEIEILRYDFATNTKNQQVVYVSDPIQEVKFTSDRLKDRITVCALTLKNKTLSLQEFELRKFRTSSLEKHQVAVNVEDATFNFSVYKDIYALIRFGKNVDLVKIVFDKKELERKPRLTFELPESETVESQMISVDELINRTKPAAALLTLKKKTVLYYFWKEKNIRVEIQQPKFSSNSLKYIILDERISFITYSEIAKKIIEINPELRSVKANALVEQKEINEYFVTTLHGKIKYLIYSNKLDNSITIKKYL